MLTGRRHRLVACALCVAVLSAATAVCLVDATVPISRSEPAYDGLSAAALPEASVGPRVLSSPMAVQATASWIGGRVTASTGETLTVYVSASLPPESGTPQSWADYFGGLLHGVELSSLTAYIATLEEVQDICRSEDVLGCYRLNTLVSTGESLPEVSREEVASHEYGHHVAIHRDNFPWAAIDWGTKRWATLANVCVRVRSFTAFPGDESGRYRLNPGEGFAEVYRAANEFRQGATTFAWPIVDSSFYPDQAALQAVERDVLEPWVQPPATRVRARFTADGPKIWKRTVSTPLDGQLSVRLSLPAPRPYKLALLAADGRSVLAKGTWSSTKDQTLSFTVCGHRSVVLRVSLAGPAGRFALTVKTP